MMDATRDVLAFARKFGAHVGTTPAVPPDEVVALRSKLIDEEFQELMQAIGVDDLPAIAKESVDLIYVVVGTLIAYGISPVEFWQAVHEAKLAGSDEVQPLDVAELLKMQSELA